MNTVRDLRCPDGHYECSVFYRVADGPPECPECHAPRVPFYATREMEGKARQDKVDAALAGFQPVLFQGERLSKEQLLERKNAYADHQGVPRDSLDFAPVGNSAERADFHRHRAWEKHKKNGFDTATLREYQREQNERSSR